MAVLVAQAVVVVEEQTVLSLAQVAMVAYWFTTRRNEDAKICCIKY
jgi:hypothetical protein